LVIWHFWPAMSVSCSAAWVIRFLSCRALPTPMFKTIFVIFGMLWTFVRLNFVTRVGTNSFVYLSAKRAI
jgi:hypothetical protein